MTRRAVFVGHVLRACVESDGETSDALRSLVAGQPLTGLVEAAEFHRVDGFAYRALHGAPGAEPEVVRLLQEAYRRAFGSHLRTLGDLELLGGILERAGIPWLVVKGPVLSEIIYPRPDLRTYADLDVIVPAEALRHTLEELVAGGCQVLDRNWRLIREIVPGELHLASPHGTLIDLHWHLLADARLRRQFRIDMRDVFENRRTVALDGRKAPTTGAADTVVHLALHACLSGGNRLVWLKDVQLAVNNGRPSWAEVIERARAWDVHLVVSTVLARARREFGADVPDGVLTALSSGGGWRTLASLTDLAMPVERARPGPSATRLVHRATRRDGRASAAALTTRLGSRVAAATGVRREPPPRAGRDPRHPSSVLFPAGDEQDRAAFLAAVDTEVHEGARS